MLGFDSDPESHLSASPQRGAVFNGLIWKNHELICNLHNKRVWLYNEMHGSPGATSCLIQIPLTASPDVDLYQPRMGPYLPLGRRLYLPVDKWFYQKAFWKELHCTAPSGSTGGKMRWQRLDHCLVTQGSSQSLLQVCQCSSLLPPFQPDVTSLSNFPLLLMP